VLGRGRSLVPRPSTVCWTGLNTVEDKLKIDILVICEYLSMNDLSLSSFRSARTAGGFRVYPHLGRGLGFLSRLRTGRGVAEGIPVGIGSG
jgi:hypothetical protein